MDRRVVDRARDQAMKKTSHLSDDELGIQISQIVDSVRESSAGRAVARSLSGFSHQRPLRGVVDTNVLIRGFRGSGNCGRIVTAIVDRCVRPVFSAETWTEFDEVLDRFGRRYAITAAAVRDFRSTVLDSAEIVRVAPTALEVRDVKDNMLIDVLDQAACDWLCSDDTDLHATGRREILGVGELMRLIEEVCRDGSPA